MAAFAAELDADVLKCRASPEMNILGTWVKHHAHIHVILKSALLDNPNLSVQFLYCTRKSYEKGQ